MGRSGGGKALRAEPPPHHFILKGRAAAVLTYPAPQMPPRKTAAPVSPFTLLSKAIADLEATRTRVSPFAELRAWRDNAARHYVRRPRIKSRKQ